MAINFGEVVGNIWSHGSKIGAGMSKGAKYGIVGGGVVGGTGALMNGDNPFTGALDGAIGWGIAGTLGGGAYMGVKGKVWATRVPKAPTPGDMVRKSAAGRSEAMKRSRDGIKARADAAASSTTMGGSVVASTTSTSNTMNTARDITEGKAGSMGDRVRRSAAARSEAMNQSRNLTTFRTKTNSGPFTRRGLSDLSKTVTYGAKNVQKFNTPSQVLRSVQGLENAGISAQTIVNTSRRPKFGQKSWGHKSWTGR
jgi:hypothetical protein